MPENELSLNIKEGDILVYIGPPRALQTNSPLIFKGERFVFRRWLGQLGEVELEKLNSRYFGKSTALLTKENIKILFKKVQND
jgi:hypothetical protein